MAGPDTEEPLFLQHAQDLRLHIEIQLADFIEKQHAALRGEKEAAVVVAGAGERAPHMTEELAFGNAGS